MIERPRGSEGIGEGGIRSRRTPVSIPQITRTALRRRTAHVLGPGPLRALTDVELNAVTFSQVVQAFAIHGALMEEILLPCIVLDEPEALVHPQCSNRSVHRVPFHGRDVVVTSRVCRLQQCPAMPV